MRLNFVLSIDMRRLVWCGVFYGLLSTTALAGPIIPISNTDQTASGTDFSSTVFQIIQQELLPFVELGGAAILLFITLNGLWSGYQAYQRAHNLDPLKQAVLASVIAIVVGGAILYLLELVRTYQFH